MAAEKKAELPPKVKSEDELGLKWDRCLADTGIKLGLTSLLFDSVLQTFCN